MKVTQEKVTTTTSKVKSAHFETITTNIAEFSLAEAVFLHKGNSG
jgi:chemotaxis protein CheY-P-specific phosphatase CheC